MELNIYTNNEKYKMHCIEYIIIWQNEGERIENAFYEIMGLKFNEEKINLLISEGKNGNYSGDSLTEEMIFRYNNR